ncbi:sel1 repeat family protein [Herbaspirillum sp. HC18]|nr:sel1 repeat family protein [Herbaspirillum sp. HC18]
MLSAPSGRFEAIKLNNYWNRMASREEIRMIQEARAGKVPVQVKLGERYLHGEGTFTKNPMTALHWLERAAEQGSVEACMLIGQYISADTVLRSSNPMRAVRWYECALEHGVLRAGVALAKVVFQCHEAPFGDRIYEKAWHALETAAIAGDVDAQWWLAQHLQGAAEATHTLKHPQRKDDPYASSYQFSHVDWLNKAADNGMAQAQRILADIAWQAKDLHTFLQRALPVADTIMEQSDGRDSGSDVRLLFRCGWALSRTGDSDTRRIESFWERAAEAGDADAQLALGLRFAKMNLLGERTSGLSTNANYRKALQWILKAAENGMPEAWYVVAKIHARSDYCSAGPTDPQRFLALSAEAGYLPAQLELAKQSWRTRHDGQGGDVRAVALLLQAAAQGSEEAQAMLDKVAERATTAPWAEDALSQLGTSVDPFLRARIELAAQFGLTRAEALLLNIHDADRRHSLLVDIRAQLRRSRRRLILITSAEQRSCLFRVSRLFENVDCGPNGPEGNYRQRVYRLQSALADYSHSQYLQLSSHDSDRQV